MALLHISHATTLIGAPDIQRWLLQPLPPGGAAPGARGLQGVLPQWLTQLGSRQAPVCIRSGHCRFVLGAHLPWLPWQILACQL